MLGLCVSTQIIFGVDHGNLCETFCDACGQLRLWCKPGKPSSCGGCGSASIVTGNVGGDDLPRMRKEWQGRHVGDSVTECVPIEDDSLPDP
jgi:hypothetical protein